DFIEHIIPANQSKVIKEMRRVLKPGGLILTYTANLIRLRMEYYINKFKYALKGRYFGWQEDRPYKDRPDLKNHQDTLLHVGLLSFYSLKKLFLRNELAIKKIIYDEWNIPLLFAWIKNNNLFFRRCRFLYGIFASNSMMLFEEAIKQKMGC
ncbi:class I SAM-dependent methyltransferase, partial [bacterium]|nr:class I SAM-dependent methyltransferase [bacterium]